MEQEMHFLSIIVPVYNAGKYLKTCVDSILKQTFQDFELLLIDDGSMDSSSFICDEYGEQDARVVVVHKRNGGVASARNKGMEIAKGDLIAFVDADDMIDPDMYKVLIDALDRTGADAAACTFSIKPKDGGVWHDNISKLFVFEGTEEIYQSMTRKEQSIEGYIWNKVYKRNILENVRFRTEIAMVSDAVYSWEIFKNVKKVCYIDLPMYQYRITPTGITCGSHPEKYMWALYSYEFMLDDAKHISQDCVDDLAKQYLGWNLTAFRAVLQCEKSVKKNCYNKIRKNVRQYQKYIGEMSGKSQIALRSIEYSYIIAVGLDMLRKILKRDET